MSRVVFPSLDSYTLSRHLKDSKRFKGQGYSRNAGYFEHTCDRDFITIQCLGCGHNMRVRVGSLDRTCPVCSYVIYNKIFEKYEEIVQSKYGRLLLLTLTSKAVKRQSVDYVRFLGSCLVRLLHRKPYSVRWKGLLAVMECKKTVSGLFYYHIHVIVEGSYVAQAKISKDWCSISGFPVIDVRRIWRTPKRALRYVLKYVLKGFVFSEDRDRLDFKASMKGVRYVRSYGSFYNFEYKSGKHVYFPCPDCGLVKSWIVMDFELPINLGLGVPYPPFLDT